MDMIEQFITFIVGLIFGAGLMIGGMCRRTKIIGFLAIKDGWDPSLLFVMIGALGVNFFTFNLILKRSTPMLANKFDIPAKKEVDWNVIVGPIIFGIGWGLSGFCPGPAMVNFLFYVQMAIFVGLLAIGQLAVGKVLPIIQSKLAKRAEEKLIEKGTKPSN